jgi:hypothetical protein
MIMHLSILGMIMKYIRFFFFLVLSVNHQVLFGINIITFFIHPFPEEQKTTITQEQMINHLQTPGKILSKTLKNHFLKQGAEGIFSTYWGYLNVSNIDGQVIFPRKHTKNSVDILVTEKIIPIMMIGNTVHYWETDPSVPSQLFSIERKQDHDTKLYFWDTQKKEPPSDKIIHLDTIIIFAKPQYMYIPTGITITDNSPQLILPDMYAKKGMNIIARTLWVLTLKHFFSSLKYIYQKNSKTYYSKQLTV